MHHTDNLFCFVVIGSLGFGAISNSYAVKVKITPEEATKTHKNVEISLYSFFNLGS